VQVPESWYGGPDSRRGPGPVESANCMGQAIDMSEDESPEF
jgi:hypothetical protein